MTSCRDILKKVFADRVAKNPAYSLRSFARDLGLSPASMSLVLNGGRGISPQMALKISQKLPFSEEQKNHFVQLATAHHGRNREARKIAEEFLSSQEHLSAINKIKVSEVLLKNWYHLAILEAINDPHIPPTVENLMKRFRLSQDQIENALKDLIAINAIVPTGPDSYQDNMGNLQVEDTPNSLPLRDFHCQIMDLGKRALSEQPSEQLYSQSVVFSVSDELLPELRKSIGRFLSDLSRIVSISEGKEQVRCLTLQQFNLE